MTSRGPGKPFGDGETIYGYQACEVHGKAFIGIDGEGSEYLCNIADGDEAVFRYVKSEKGFSKAVLRTLGEAEVELSLDGEVLGSVKIQEDGKHEMHFSNRQKGGKEQEMVLKFTAAEDFKVISVTLYE